MMFLVSTGDCRFVHLMCDRDRYEVQTRVIQPSVTSGHIRIKKCHLHVTLIARLMTSFCPLHNHSRISIRSQTHSSSCIDRAERLWYPVHDLSHRVAMVTTTWHTHRISLGSPFVALSLIHQGLDAITVASADILLLATVGGVIWCELIVADLRRCFCNCVTKYMVHAAIPSVIGKLQGAIM